MHFTMMVSAENLSGGAGAQLPCLGTPGLYGHSPPPPPLEKTLQPIDTIGSPAHVKGTGAESGVPPAP